MKQLRTLIAALMLLAFSGRALAAIALVASTIAGSPTNNNVTTSAIDTTGATLIVISANYITGATLSAPTDSKSNGTPTALTARNGTGGSASTRLYYWDHPASVGSGHTFTFTCNGWPTIGVMAFSGTKTGGFENENGNGQGAATSNQTGSCAATQNGSLFVTGLGVYVPSVTGIGVDGGYSANKLTHNSDGTSVAGAISYFLQGTAGTENPTWSWTSSRSNAAAIADFKPDASGAIQAFYLRQLMGEP